VVLAGTGMVPVAVPIGLGTEVVVHVPPSDMPGSLVAVPVGDTVDWVVE
jgi:hypothetical protein